MFRARAWNGNCRAGTCGWHPDARDDSKDSLYLDECRRRKKPKTTLPLERHPFVRRAAFGDEREVRVPSESAEHTHDLLDLLDLPIPLDCVARITLRPWPPRGLVEATASQRRSIEVCAGLEVLRSAIVNSEACKDIARQGGTPLAAPLAARPPACRAGALT